MPIIIKRYTNRKLYDTDKKQYITLSGIASYIQEGEEVIVIDNTTGEDISNLTLTQIIFEKEREKTGFFPKSILAGLIKTSGDTFENIRRSLTSPKELMRQVNDEIERRLDVLIEQGKITLDEAVGLRDNLLNLGHRDLISNQPIESIIENILKERGVPSRNEFRQLINDVELISEKIDRYNDVTGEIEINDQN